MFELDGQPLEVGGAPAHDAGCCCNKCLHCSCCDGIDACFSTDFAPNGETNFSASAGTTGITVNYGEGPVDIATLTGGHVYCEEPPVCGDGTITWERVIVHQADTSTGTDRLISRLVYSSGPTLTWVVQHTDDAGTTWTDTTTIVTSGTRHVTDPPSKCNFIWESYTDNLTSTTHTITPPTFGMSGLNDCCRGSDGECRCDAPNCEGDGECIECVRLDPCCFDTRSEVTATLSAISFDIASVSDPDRKADLETVLTQIGLTNGGSGDVWSGSISRTATWYYRKSNVETPSPPGTWRVCDDTLDTLPPPLTFEWFEFQFLPYLFSWNVTYRALPTTIYGSTSTDSENLDFNCCGGSGEIELTLRHDSTTVDTCTATLGITIAKNRCCNCRGTSRDGFSICGPTSDGSEAVCEDDFTGDHNTCPDPDQLTKRNNVCSTSQDEECRDVCSIDDGVPDMLTLSIGGADILLTRVGNDWSYFCCKGETGEDGSDCVIPMDVEYTVHHDAEPAVDYDYVCDYEYDPETDEYTPVWCHYHADAIEAYDETLHATGTACCVSVTFLGCQECQSEYGCYSLNVGIMHGGCGQVNPFGCFALGRPQIGSSCSDPRGEYCLWSGACLYASIEDNCSAVATIS